jgi:hypothetical protein
MIGAGAPPVTRAFLALTLSILAVRLALIRRFLTAIAVQSAVPVHDHFFPWILREPIVLATAFFVPLATELLVLRRPTPRRMRISALTVTLGAAALLVHQASYFYATWVVVFWAGTLLVWMAWNGAADPERAAKQGPFLAQLLVGFWFLGGAAGKWTGGYWAGRPFHDLFFLHGPYLQYAQLRTSLDESTLRTLATWFSRWVVLVETAMAFTIFLPARLASTITVVVALGMWISAPDLLDVAWPIIGTALAGRFLIGSGR